MAIKASWRCGSPAATRFTGPPSGASDADSPELGIDLADELRDEPPADLAESFGIETAGDFHCLHRVEIIAVAAGDGPTQHPARRAGDVLERMHHPAWNECRQSNAGDRIDPLCIQNIK